jgi:CRISPR-associated protein Csd1
MLLQALNEFYERATQGDNPLIDEPAFNPKAIRWIIPLNREGNLEGVGLIETPKEKNRHKEFKRAPRGTRPKNAGGVSEFLADGLAAVFGLEGDPEATEPNERKRARQAENLHAKHEDFWRQIRQAFETLNDERFAALLRFAEQYLASDEAGKPHVPLFLRWGKSNEADENEKPSWWVKTSTGTETKLGSDNFTFQVDDEVLIESEAVQDYWRQTFTAETEAKEESATTGLCLVTGNANAPIMATHLPKIGGVPGATPTGALLVSFDKESFTSYGFDKSYNAPVSAAAVTAYANALNFMLRNDSNHSLKIGNTALCFWARQSEEVTRRMSRLLDRPRPEAVREFLKSPFAGDADRAPLKHDRFYSVTLGGNAGRVVVRHWMQTTVEQAMENFRQWFVDLDIAPYAPVSDKENETSPPLSLYRLARTTVREEKDLQPETTTQLYRAALEGSAPSLVLTKKIVARFNVDFVRNGLDALRNLSRFALLRLIINRNRKEDEPMIEPTLSDTEDTAYNCGRLLAIFDDLQMAAHDYKLEGAGVVERYYGAASSAPNTAFGILWRLHQHHLKKLARSGDGGRAKAEALKHKIEEIACRFQQRDPRFPPEFPRAFDMRAQGRFALGFYQQKAAERQARTAYLEARKAEANATENQTATNEPTSTQGDSNNE